MIKRSLAFLIIIISLVFLSHISCGEHSEFLVIPSPALKMLMANKWNLESYGEIGNELSLLDGTEIHIQFNNEDECWGSAGCNDYFGSFAARTERLISISTLISTERFCSGPDGIMEQEEYYLDTLLKVTEYEVSSSHLRLFYDNRSGVLNYSAD
jgi:heat shock protein HslJ